MSKGANCSHFPENKTEDCNVKCLGCTGNICMHDEDEINECKLALRTKNVNKDRI